MTAEGISIIIGSVSGAIVLVGGFALQVAAFVRQGQMMKTGQATHDLVNGQSAKIEAMTFKAGEVSGADKERASPTTGNHPVDAQVP